MSKDQQRIMTKRDTPAAKRGAPPEAPSTLALRDEVQYFTPPIERVEEEDEQDKTVPMPEPWFQDHDALYGVQG